MFSSSKTLTSPIFPESLEERIQLFEQKGYFWFCYDEIRSSLLILVESISDKKFQSKDSLSLLLNDDISQSIRTLVNENSISQTQGEVLWKIEELIQATQTSRKLNTAKMIIDRVDIFLPWVFSWISAVNFISTGQKLFSLHPKIRELTQLVEKQFPGIHIPIDSPTYTEDIIELIENIISSIIATLTILSVAEIPFSLYSRKKITHIQIEAYRTAQAIIHQTQLQLSDLEKSI